MGLRAYRSLQYTSLRKYSKNDHENAYIDNSQAPYSTLYCEAITIADDIMFSGSCLYTTEVVTPSTRLTYVIPESISKDSPRATQAANDYFYGAIFSTSARSICGNIKTITTPIALPTSPSTFTKPEFCYDDTPWFTVGFESDAIMVSPVVPTPYKPSLPEPSLANPSVTTTSQPQEASSALPRNTIALISTISSMIFLTLLGVCVWYLWRRKRLKHRTDDETTLSIRRAFHRQALKFSRSARYTTRADRVSTTRNTLPQAPRRMPPIVPRPQGRQVLSLTPPPSYTTRAEREPTIRTTITSLSRIPSRASSVSSLAPSFRV